MIPEELTTTATQRARPIKDELPANQGNVGDVVNEIDCHQ